MCAVPPHLVRHHSAPLIIECFPSSFSLRTTFRLCSHHLDQSVVHESAGFFFPLLFCLNSLILNDSPQPTSRLDMGNHIATCCETDSNKNEMQKGRVREQEHAKRIAEMKAALGNGATGPLTTGMVEQSFQARKSQCVLSPRSIAT